MDSQLVSDDKTYCLHLADNAETMREHARRGGFPADHVALVRALIDPTNRRDTSRGRIAIGYADVAASTP
jgi:hypothetical protein